MIHIQISWQILHFTVTGVTKTTIIPLQRVKGRHILTNRGVLRLRRLMVSGALLHLLQVPPRLL